MNKLSILGMVMCGLAQQAIAAPVNDTLAKAKQTVESYQNLRDSCAQASDKQRQDCLSRLSAASDDYRAAKQLVAANVSAPRLASNRRNKFTAAN